MLLLALVAMAVWLQDDLALWYYRTLGLDLLHEDYGFTAAPTPTGMLVIRTIKDGGVLERAGLRPGDAPLNDHDPYLFYAFLACGHDPTVVRIWRPSQQTTFRARIPPAPEIRALCLPWL
jgi:hypothetical protein